MHSMSTPLGYRPYSTHNNQNVPGTRYYQQKSGGMSTGAPNYHFSTAQNHQENSILEAEKLLNGLRLAPMLPHIPPVYSTDFGSFSSAPPPNMPLEAMRRARTEDMFPFTLAGTTQQQAPLLPAAFARNHFVSEGSIFSHSMPPADTICNRTDLVTSAAFGRPPAVDVSTRRGAGYLSAPAQRVLGRPKEEVFARKVFVGGLPIDVSEQEIWQTFRVFGNVLVDWPRRSDVGPSRDDDCGFKTGPGRSMTGYVFLVFEEEQSVQRLVSQCHKDCDKYYLFISSPTMRDKPVQVRPWRLADMDYILERDMPLDHRRTVFIGGVPRPTKAKDLAECLNKLYGAVCYVGIDIDPELKYPKGAARVTFITTQAFIAAIAGRFVHIHHAESQKRVEIKPYVMDEQMCDECQGKRCMSRYAPYFCGAVGCLQYFCEACWDLVHLRPGKYADHRPLVRMGDQTKMLPRPPHHNNNNNNHSRGGNRHVSRNTYGGNMV